MSKQRGRPLNKRPHSTLTEQRAYYNLGLLHGYRKEVDQAQAAYAAALAADSTLAPAYKKLGKIQREKGFPPEAAGAFKKAVRFDPQDAEAHFLLGLAQRDMGDNEAALQALLKATELNPDSPKLRLNLGNVYLRLGRREEGKREMARSESLRQQHRRLALRNLPAGAQIALYRLGAGSLQYGFEAPDGRRNRPSFIRVSSRGRNQTRSQRRPHRPRPPPRRTRPTKTGSPVLPSGPSSWIQKIPFCTCI